VQEEPDRQSAKLRFTWKTPANTKTRTDAGNGAKTFAQRTRTAWKDKHGIPPINTTLSTKV